MNLKGPDPREMSHMPQLQRWAESQKHAPFITKPGKKTKGTEGDRVCYIGKCGGGGSVIPRTVQVGQGARLSLRNGREKGEPNGENRERGPRVGKIEKGRMVVIAGVCLQ